MEVTALALFVAWPAISLVAQYVWLNHGISGITGAIAVVESFGYYISVLLTDPVKGTGYLGFLGMVGRLAWR